MANTLAIGSLVAAILVALAAIYALWQAHRRDKATAARENERDEKADESTLVQAMKHLETNLRQDIGRVETNLRADATRTDNRLTGIDHRLNSIEQDLRRWPYRPEQTEVAPSPGAGGGAAFRDYTQAAQTGTPPPTP